MLDHTQSQLEAVELEVNIIMATGVIEVQALSFTTSQPLEAEVEALELIPVQNHQIHQTEMVDLAVVVEFVDQVLVQELLVKATVDLVHLEQTKSLKMVAEAERVALMRDTLLEVLDIIHSYQIHFLLEVAVAESQTMPMQTLVDMVHPQLVLELQTKVLVVKVMLVIRVMDLLEDLVLFLLGMRINHGTFCKIR